MLLPSRTPSQPGTSYGIQTIGRKSTRGEEEIGGQVSTLAQLCKCRYVDLVTVEPQPRCSADSHTSQRLELPVHEPAIERTARIFRALGEPTRIRLLARLAQGEARVTELAELERESITVISQRLRVLRADNIVGPAARWQTHSVLSGRSTCAGPGLQWLNTCF